MAGKSSVPVAGCHMPSFIEAHRQARRAQHLPSCVAAYGGRAPPSRARTTGATCASQALTSQVIEPVDEFHSVVPATIAAIHESGPSRISAISANFCHQGLHYHVIEIKAENEFLHFCHFCRARGRDPEPELSEFPTFPTFATGCLA